jgi:spore coat polysaccharide biosynthesis predicted glycosyltransferase SpsG
VNAPRIAIRCDGGATIGAGHVARCRPLALAFREHACDPHFVGRFDGLAAALATSTGLSLEPPGQGPLGVDPSRFDAAIVDLYDVDVCALARELPVATPGEASHCADAGVRIDYHLDRDASEDGPRLLAGPTYAPIDPAFAQARRDRAGVELALMTLGGSEAVRALAPSLTRGLAEAFPGAALLMTAGLPAADGVSVEQWPDGAMLPAAAARADLAVTAAGLTAYELACAGVPFLALVVVDNQERVGRALQQTGAGLVLDVRAGLDSSLLEQRLRQLADPAVRARLATTGERLLDGGGARRATAALIRSWGLGR